MIPSPLSEKVFAVLQRHRYLSTAHLHAHVGGSKQHLQRHLTDLHHETNTPHGGRYLDRPQQRLLLTNLFYRPETYENSKHAFAHLTDRGAFDALAYKLSHVGRTGTHREYPHEVMACEVLSSIELGARRAGLEFIEEHRVLDRAPQATLASDSPFTFSFDGTRLTPDRMFGVRYASGKVRFFALEADRGTMPLRRTGDGSSYARKLGHYRRMITGDAHVERLGIPNLVVLTVTTGTERLRSMLALARELGAPSYLAFKAVPAFGEYMRTPPPLPELFDEPWTRADHPPFAMGIA